MLSKEEKTKILDRFTNKDEKILVSNILDKAYKYEKTDKLEFTSFLNLNEQNIIKGILNSLDIEYTVYPNSTQIEKKAIFFIPSYITDVDKSCSEYVECIKITTRAKGKLKHKDYMGSIYSLGLKRECIGDIFVSEDFAYVFCMHSVSQYILQNLLKVANQEVETKKVTTIQEAIDSIKIEYIIKDYIVPSLRVDAILSSVYKMSRSESKDKIVNGDLYINDKNIFFPNEMIKDKDIVSLKKHGKFKIGQVISQTKSGKIRIQIQNYK